MSRRSVRIVDVEEAGIFEWEGKQEKRKIASHCRGVVYYNDIVLPDGAL